MSRLAWWCQEGCKWNGDLTFSHVFGGSVCFAG